MSFARAKGGPVRGGASRLRAIARRAVGRSTGTRVTPLPEVMLELTRRGPAPLRRRAAHPGPLQVAAIVPSFRRGSGGHGTIVRVLEALRARGHAVSVWLEDHEGRHAAEPDAITRASFNEFFATEQLELHTDFATWQTVDVVLATGWQTVARALLLPDAAARAYLVQDHEPAFYGASAESLWAAETYRQGLQCIAASAWLAELLHARYGARARHFDLAVDHRVYHPASRDARGADGGAPARGHPRVLFYARAVTPRRAVPLGLLALAELHRRRPAVEIVIYGEDRPLDVPFAHRNVGLLAAEELAELYRAASAGMVLSLTNPSLVALEMMASGLACVELASESMLASFGEAGPLCLAQPDPLALCAALEHLLDDDAYRARASTKGLELMRERTWERAGEQVEEGLHSALDGAQIDASRPAGCG